MKVTTTLNTCTYKTTFKQLLLKLRETEHKVCRFQETLHSCDYIYKTLKNKNDDCG